MTATAPSPRQLRGGGVGVRSPGAGGLAGRNGGGSGGEAKQQPQQRAKDSLSLTLSPSSLASPKKGAAVVPPSTDWLSDLKSAFGVSTSTTNGASKDAKKAGGGDRDRDRAAAAGVAEEEGAEAGSGALEQVMSYVKVRLSFYPVVLLFCCFVVLFFCFSVVLVLSLLGEIGLAHRTYPPLVSSRLVPSVLNLWRLVLVENSIDPGDGTCHTQLEPDVTVQGVPYGFLHFSYLLSENDNTGPIVYVFMTTRILYIATAYHLTTQCRTYQL